jgi:hypothetical protein
MSSEPEYPFRHAMTDICRGVTDAVCNQPGETPERTAARRRAVFETMASMLPNDPLETTLAGQCVIFDHVVREAATVLLGGQPETTKLRLRPQICASSRMLLANLAELRRTQADAEAKLGSQPAAAPTQTEAVATADKTPEPAEEPAAASATESTANGKVVARAPVQPPVCPPADTRVELNSILERHGLTTADTDKALIEAYRDRPAPDRARNAGEHSASPMPGDTRQAERVEELV